MSIFSRLPSSTTDKLTVRKCPLSGGYTRSGQYFGGSNNLWIVEGESGEHHLRASSLTDARAKAIVAFPNADWGKTAKKKLEKDAAAYLAKAIGHVQRAESALEQGSPYPDQERALLKYWKNEIPKAEAELVAAQRVNNPKIR